MKPNKACKAKAMLPPCYQQTLILHLTATLLSAHPYPPPYCHHVISLILHLTATLLSAYPPYPPPHCHLVISTPLSSTLLPPCYQHTLITATLLSAYPYPPPHCHHVISTPLSCTSLPPCYQHTLILHLTATLLSAHPYPPPHCHIVISTPLGAIHKLRHAEGGEGGISQCDDVYIKHTSVWDNV